MITHRRGSSRTVASSADDDGLASAMDFVWLLIAFKVATVAIIFYYHQSFDTGLMLGATTWHWLLVLAPAISGPILFRYRLRRVRAKRAELQRAEWLVDQPEQEERASIGR